MKPMITSIIIGHFVGDYLLQSKWMFSKKDAVNGALLAHVFVYSLSVFAFLQSFLLFSGETYDNTLLFIAINAFVHLLIDGVCSKVTKIYLKRFDYGAFFVILGLDQTLHVLTLINTL